jgi:putative nucleotidyltransferase with HDIG domain
MPELLLPDPTDALHEAALRDDQQRATRAWRPAEARLELLVAAGFAVAALALGFLAGGDRPVDPWALLLLPVFLVACRVELPMGSVYAIPTQVVFVPLLLLLPTAWVPALVGATFVAGRLPDVLAGRARAGRLVAALGDGWHAIGPAAVLVAFGATSPDWTDWPVYVLALAAQIAFDAAFCVLREQQRFAKGVAALPRSLGSVYALDLLLAPLGLLAAFAGAAQPGTELLGATAVALVALVARERHAHVARALELSDAYRGTACLLGDVLEHDDASTGHHSSAVVTLAVEVAAEMGLDDRERRLTELGAMLHDIGKLAVPKAVLHKRGPLDAAEWAVMRRHTLDGEQLLRRVGGYMDDVAVVVRASHERWDGTGYPDGLLGPQTPLPARIVSACDAYDAMVSDRPYRAALSAAAAVAELRRSAGGQFDPAVVDALLRVLDGGRRSPR